MNKTFFFMAGLPRSGSTLLSAILNQNPDVYASPQTDLLQMMYLLDTNIVNFESYRAGINHEGYKNAMSKLGESFYEHRSEQFIVDKNRAWGTPYNLNLARLLNPQVRILLPYRPILEILASFVQLARKNPDVNFIDRLMVQEDFYSGQYRSKDDARCDYLMRPNGEIDKALFSLALSKQYPENFLLVNYEQLIQQPAATLSSIYDFLELPNFIHTFKRIQHDELFVFDGEVFGIPELHEIRTELKVTSSKPEIVLSDYVINKYGQALDFL